MTTIEEKTINTIRVLSAEGVQKANSGHPGIALGSAPIAYTLYADALKFNPADPNFTDRDRFVLSAGHGSMLLYSALHVFGYDLSKDDLMSFRQLDSRTPGHPEYRHTPGVETTTGPLGQGVANAVGMAMAESILAARFNRPGCEIVNHYTYCLCGDGCMMEGIESEAASFAGTNGLNKLILIYDSNNISIEGNTDIAFREDVAARHEAQGWQVLCVDDMHDLGALRAAIVRAKVQTKKPTLIIVKTVIGYGSPNAGSEETHGAPLGEKNLAEMKKYLAWTEEPFTVPADVKEYTQKIAEKGAKEQRKWKHLLNKYKEEYPADYAEFIKWTTSAYQKVDLVAVADLWECADKPEATRNTGAQVLKKLSALIPNIAGGSADLAPSNKTYLKGRGDYSKDEKSGLNFHFGVREHAMAAITNGIQLHGGFQTYCSTFFVFSDYMRGAMRMSAIMDIPVMYILTHDSIGVGEDGATHQPVEHLASLRAVPNMNVYRPADYRETAACYISAVKGSAPSCLVLTRQNLPQLDGSGANAFKGGYVLSDCDGKPDALLLGSGSEVHLLVGAQKILAEKGVKTRVVSMPCMEIFDAQSRKYRNSVLPRGVRVRLAAEAGSAMPWYKYIGLDGVTVCVDSFGKSAPAEKLFELYGFSAENIARKVLIKLGKY